MKSRVTEAMDAQKRHVCCSKEAPGKGEQKGEGKVERVPAVILLSRRIWSLLSGGTTNGVL